MFALFNLYGITQNMWCLLRCKQSIRQIPHNGLLKNYWTRITGIFRAAVEKLVHSSELFCQMKQAVREAAKICRRR